MDQSREYQQACREAVHFDVSDRGKIELTGPEARVFLHNLCTNDILHLTPQTGCEAFFTNAKAKVVSHAYVYRILISEQEESLWLDAAPGMAEKLIQHLEHFRISEQVEFADRTRQFAQLHLAGPQVDAVLARSLQQTIPPIEKLEDVFVLSQPGAVSQVRRHQHLGLPGYDLLCSTTQAESLRNLLTQNGSAPAGKQTYETLRVEAGTPIQGQDFDETNLVMEVGRIKQSICYTKGCFLGQEPIVRARDIGHVNRTLTGVKIQGEEPVSRGAKLYRESEEVGLVTSSVVSPRLGSAIALAYVRRGSQEPGTRLEVETEGGRRVGEVSSLPFVAAG